MHERTLLNDGSRADRFHDATNLVGWSSCTLTIDAEAAALQRVAELGEGATLVLSRDAANARTWMVAAALQDAEGNLLFHAVITDGGSFAADPSLPVTGWPF
ncbi:MAG TPA: hypothetical protein VNZ61_05885 [Roseomonas sp.]|nr:hypothetical protein [Roseomonas sp.]